MTLLLILISSCGLFHLAHINPKRRRALKLISLEKRNWFWPALLCLILPTIHFIWLANWSGFLIWFGAITLIGWGIAFITPKHLQSLTQQSLSQMRPFFSYFKPGGLQILLTNLSILKNNLNDAFCEFFDPHLETANKRISKLEKQIQELEEKLKQFENKKNLR